MALRPRDIEFDPAGATFGELTDRPMWPRRAVYALASSAAKRKDYKRHNGQPAPITQRRLNREVVKNELTLPYWRSAFNHFLSSMESGGFVERLVDNTTDETEKTRTYHGEYKAKDGGKMGASLTVGSGEETSDGSDYVIISITRADMVPHRNTATGERRNFPVLSSITAIKKPGQPLEHMGSSALAFEGKIWLLEEFAKATFDPEGTQRLYEDYTKHEDKLVEWIAEAPELPPVPFLDADF